LNIYEVKETQVKAQTLFDIPPELIANHGKISRWLAVCAHVRASEAVTVSRSC
jgi:hypothetical protein